MTQTAVDVIRFRMGPFELAADLQAVSSVLAFAESDGLALLDPAPHLGLSASRHGHVGLLSLDVGPPMGVCLGQVHGTEKWTRYNLLPMPLWLGRWMPSVLKPACGYDSRRQIVWLLDLADLRRLYGSGTLDN